MNVSSNCSKPQFNTKSTLPMAHEPDMALCKTASGSLASRFTLLSISSKSIAKQRIPPEQLSKATAGVKFRCHIARHSIGQISVELDDFSLLCNTNDQLHGSCGNTFENLRR